MATDYKTLTTEQKESLNERRRARYAAMSQEKKDALLETQRQRDQSKTPEQREAKRASQRIPQRSSAYGVRNSDGTTTLLTNPDTQKWIAKIDQRRKRREKRFWERAKEIKDWRASGGLVPWPNLKRKLIATELFLECKRLLGDKCFLCPATDRNVLEFSWRITRITDPLAFVGQTMTELRRVQRNPGDHILLCLHCAFNIRIMCFAYIFSPFSPRNGGSIEVFKTLYPEIGHRIHDIYPPGQTPPKGCTSLVNKYGLLKLNPYHAHVAETPRPIVWKVLRDQIKEHYATPDIQGPSGQVQQTSQEVAKDGGGVAPNLGP